MKVLSYRLAQDPLLWFEYMAPDQLHLIPYIKSRIDKAVGRTLFTVSIDSHVHELEMIRMHRKAKLQSTYSCRDWRTIVAQLNTSLVIHTNTPLNILEKEPQSWSHKWGLDYKYVSENGPYHHPKNAFQTLQKPPLCCQLTLPKIQVNYKPLISPVNALQA